MNNKDIILYLSKFNGDVIMKYLTLIVLVLGVMASAEMAVAQEQRFITLPEPALGHAPFGSIQVPGGPDVGGGGGGPGGGGTSP